MKWKYVAALHVAVSCKLHARLMSFSPSLFMRGVSGSGACSVRYIHLLLPVELNVHNFSHTALTVRRRRRRRYISIQTLFCAHQPRNTRANLHKTISHRHATQFGFYFIFFYCVLHVIPRAHSSNVEQQRFAFHFNWFFSSTFLILFGGWPHAHGCICI